MNTAQHTAALAGYFLAPPKPSPTATSLSAQFNYALSSWTPGARIMLAAIAAVIFVVWLIGRRAVRSRQQ